MTLNDTPPIKHTQWKEYKSHIVIFILGLLLLFSPVKNSIDHFLYDHVLRYQLKQNDNKVAIIAIDDHSIDQIGQWPWQRTTHVKLLQSIQKAKISAIGFDVLFTGASLNTAIDMQFAQQLKASNNVVLAVAPSASSPFSTGNYELLPTPILAQHAAKLGHVDFEIDNDGKIRETYLYAGYKETKWPAFGLALTQLSGYPVSVPDNSNTLGQGWVRGNPRLITFKSVMQPIPVYSYADVLNGLVDVSELDNKIVIIGMTASAMGDRFVTPISPPHNTTPGVMVNANFVNDLVNNASVNKFNSTFIITMNIILIIITIVVFFRCPLNRMLPIIVGFVLADLLAVILTYNLFFHWYSPTSLIAFQCLIYALFVLVKSNQLFSEVHELHHTLIHDKVTGLANETGLNKQLKILTASIDKPPFHLITIKFGKFKGINDLLGNNAGNELLIQAKNKLQLIVPNAILMARFHGAEFTVCIPQTKDMSDLKRIGQTILDVLCEPFVIQEQTFKLPVSIGIATFPSDGSHRRSLIEATGAALDRALENVEPTMCIYSHDIKLQLKERAKLESDLAIALQENQIDIYYQPQVEAATGKIVGAEALARWHHPELGLIDPHTFIPIAESTGHIIEIGNWILNKACKRAKTIQNEGYSNFRIAVNLSSVQFSYSKLISDVQSALLNSGLEARFLELELTESCVVDDINAAVDTLNKLKAIGVYLSIDDFGTGYSSLSYLKHFPMDRIKIDRSFVSSIDENNNSKEITLAIIAMANSLNMKVIAEGIETLEQQMFLSDHKVQELQGFFFGKPLPVDELNDLLTANSDTSKANQNEMN